MDDINKHQSKKENNEKPVSELTTEACTNDKNTQDEYMKLTYGERYLKALNACTVIERNL